MSPVPTASPAKRADRQLPLLPYPQADLLRDVAKEIVVDWQLPSDGERKN